MIAVIRKLWIGGYPLSAAFWKFYVGLDVLVILAAFPTTIVSALLNVNLVYPLLLIRFAILILTSVGVWRSAGHTVSSAEKPMAEMWAILARAVVVVWLFSIVLKNIAALMGMTWDQALSAAVSAFFRTLKSIGL
jgi:hypothetical protein